ncbi:D-ribose pyranase [Thermoanaerobacterium thermosaccharolyticum]|uniref:D-ribose pyranase n=1 Tax=Thermoanaerobacterium thermosaccharolyticum TaxID=1517 RepID=UPI0020A3C0BC|nr:D-ribose pyranase [Thermoanaerobacterium thermosaccharolyticum]MCP2240327.1 D-ribose pyranase [Thermoanaerobacterium thermosaccharolyticum]
MKKFGVLNKDLSGELAGLGHMDEFIICDAGFPIPKEAKRIDLALTKGLPGFMDTLKAILSEVVVEKVIVAEETEKVSPEFFEQLRDIFKYQEFVLIPHSEFKNKSKEVKFIVRTGEFIPYANMLLVAASQADEFKKNFDLF